MEQIYFDSDYPQPNTRIVVDVPSNVTSATIKKVLLIMNPGKVKYQLLVSNNQGIKKIAVFKSLTNICSNDNDCAEIDNGRLTFIRSDWPILNDLINIKNRIEAKKQLVRILK